MNIKLTHNIINLSKKLIYPIIHHASIINLII